VSLLFQIARLLSSYAIGVLIWSVVFATRCASAASTNEVLATAAELLSLTDERASQRIPVCVTGVVTLAEPNWGGLFFVQDATGGTFVNYHDAPPALGDLVQVTGVSHPGGFAPDIFEPKLKKLGTAPLPEARPVSVERLVSGAEDGRRVEVSGVVRSVRVEGKQLVLQLAQGGFRFRAYARVSTNVDAKSLVGATVRMRGTAAAAFNPRLRQILGVNIFVPQESDFLIDHMPGTAIAELPLTSLRGILQYHWNEPDELRIRVRGVVTYQRPGVDIFLQDQTDGLQVRTRETNTFAPGEIVEAVGFPVMEGDLPVLQDAILLRTKEPAGRVVSRDATIQELRQVLHHGDMITLEGTLLDRSLRPLRAGNSASNAPAETILTLQCSNYLVSVAAPVTKKFADLASIPIGSALEVSGLCLLQVRPVMTTEGVVLEAVQVLLPDIASIRILRRPSWWTPQRLLAGVGILLGISMVGAIWALTILRKNSALKASISERAKTQQELQMAHDLLESRVEERTKELKFEIGARKEVEVRVEAIVEERKRIAQELHDTLLQGFTGVGLKLEALASALPESLSRTKEQLEAILEKSDEYMTEARRSVWKLRSPSLEKHADFPTALMRVSERAIEGTGIGFIFLVDGAVRTAEHDIEGNLLRICEEAVANAVKHAHPTQVEVNLQYDAEELGLRIRDNGCGFNPDAPEGEKAGHFGLVGIRERAKSLAGNVSLKSRPGQGTEIIVRLPCPNGRSKRSTADVPTAVETER
jgi:signal transduction histidine kinase